MPTVDVTPAQEGAPSRPQAPRRTHARRQREYRFRVMVYPRAGRWRAECVDLDLIVARQAPNEALDELCRQVQQNVQTVEAQGLPEYLLHRKSPWTHRFYWYAYALFARITDALHRRIPDPHPCYFDDSVRAGHA